MAVTKLEAPVGTLPVLQYLVPNQLSVDGAYQRSCDNAGSQALIRKIASRWDWTMCSPLVVSRRSDGTFAVIDGQHRLAAANLRGDIQVLPCVVVEYPSIEAEAAAFVKLNASRRPLNKLEIFRGAVASGDAEAVAIVSALDAAGLRLAKGLGSNWWGPGELGNIGGLQSAWRQYGPEAFARALMVLAHSYPGAPLCHAGTIFPGVVSICAETEDASELNVLVRMVRCVPQPDWRRRVMLAKAEDPNMSVARASEQVLNDAWNEALGAYLEREAA